MVRRNLFPLRHNLTANFRAIVTSCVEFAALRRVDRTGNIAFQNMKLAVALANGRNSGNECLRIRMHRMVKDFLRRRKLNHIAQIHDADSVGNILYNRKVMCDKQIGQLGVFLQILKQVDNLRLNGYIQCGNRFIADYKLRLNSQRSGDASDLQMETSSAEIGSSAMMKSGSMISARAMPMR